MAFVPVPNVAMVEIRGSVDSQDVENTLYFEKAGTIVDGDLANIAGNTRTWVTDEWLQAVGSAWQGRELVVTDLTTATSGQVSVSLSGETGVIEEAIMPNNVTACVSFRTAFRGRSFRGRNYMPAIPISAVTGLNELTTGYMNNVANRYANLIANPILPSWSWVVVSRFTNNAPRTSGIGTPVVSVIFADNTVDSMRRRLPGRGR